MTTSRNQPSITRPTDLPARRAVVTGGAGFVGSHLVDRLIAGGLEVLVLDDLSTGTLDNLTPHARFERLDIADGPLEATLRSWRPHVVYHLAAQSSVPISSRDPIRDLAVNVIGTHRVAAAARTSGAERLVFVSSGGAIYGDRSRPATEASIPAPASYYGIHKLAAEGHVALSDVPSAIARPANIYGPRQSAGLEGAVVAAFLRQAEDADRLTIHGDGSQSRDFVHVSDVVEALWLLGRPDGPDGILNIASGRRTTIEQLAGIVERAVGRPLARVHTATRTGDVLHSSISAARLRACGWAPRVRLLDGVARLGEASRAAGTSSGSPETAERGPAGA